MAAYIFGNSLSTNLHDPPIPSLVATDSHGTHIPDSDPTSNIYYVSPG